MTHGQDTGGQATLCRKELTTDPGRGLFETDFLVNRDRTFDGMYTNERIEGWGHKDVCEDCVSEFDRRFPVYRE